LDRHHFLVLAALLKIWVFSMRKSFLALAGVLIGGAMLASPSKAAVVKVTDLGSLPLDTSVYFGTSGAGSFSNYFKFELRSALTDASVTFSDSVKPNVNPALPSPLLITGGTLRSIPARRTAPAAGLRRQVRCSRARR
jgi:hypothetical protein